MAAGADPILVRHWRRATDSDLAALVHAAREGVDAFASVTAARGSLLQSWIGGASVVEYEHYPPDDVVDRASGSQFYYHAHRDGDLEHGHLHLFWHATSSGRRRRLREGSTAWVRTAPSHLFAISLDARGLPVGLFTVNRWVTGGHWFDAATTMDCVDRFAPTVDGAYEDACRWLRAFVSMYRPRIRWLLARRDWRLARRVDRERALSDRRLELLSLHRLDWAADLDALEAESTRRIGF